VRSPWALLGWSAVRAFLMAVFLGGLVVCPVSAWGQTVSLQVQVIYAANQDGGVDSRLGALAENLKKTFRYSMYQLLDAPKGSVALNEVWRTPLPDNRSLEITPTAVQENQYSLKVIVLGSGGQPSFNTVVRLRRGSTVLVGGPSHQKGVLIIAISAS
jgi:hypothetical protein